MASVHHGRPGRGGASGVRIAVALRRRPTRRALTLYRRAPGPLSGAEWLAASAYAAAASELLTLERRGLDLTGLAGEWGGTRPERSADHARHVVPGGEPGGVPATADRMPLACWFGPRRWRPVRERVGAAALDDPEHSAWWGVNIIRRACTSVDVTSDATGTRVLLSYRIGTRPPR